MSHFYRSDQSQLKEVYNDLVEGFRRADIWQALAWSDLQGRYGRSMLGIAWNMVSFAAFSIAIAYLFNLTNNADAPTFGPHVVIGFWVYTLISSIVTDSCSTFTANQSWIKSTRLPLGVYMYKVVQRAFVIAFYNGMAAVLILYFLFDVDLSALHWSHIPAVGLYVITGVGCTMFLGIVAARLHDVTHLVQTVMRFALLATPIMWQTTGTGFRSQVAVINPLTHYIELIRTPALTGEIPALSWLIAVSCSLALLLAGLLVLYWARRRLVYWL